MSSAVMIDVMRTILVANELGGDLAAAYRFSDPDGVHTGKSGWSFGVSQFDINNNPLAVQCLKDCAFSADQIDYLVKQKGPAGHLNDRLKAYSHVVDAYDARQFNGCLDHVLSLGLPWAIPGDLMYHLADYHNQFHLSVIDKPGYCFHWLKGLTQPPTPEEFLDWKLHNTKWGRERGDDVRRRFANIARILAAAKAAA